MFEVGDEVRFWTREECSEVTGSGALGDNTWGEVGIVLARKGSGYYVQFGDIQKEIGPRAAKPVHPTEYELALEVLGEDYFQ